MEPVRAIFTRRTYPIRRRTPRRRSAGRRVDAAAGPTSDHRARDRSRALRVVPPLVLGLGQPKLSPQAQELPALGLSMVKPCFSIVSAKSTVAPPR